MRKMTKLTTNVTPVNPTTKPSAKQWFAKVKSVFTFENYIHFCMMLGDMIASTITMLSRIAIIVLTVAVVTALINSGHLDWDIQGMLQSVIDFFVTPFKELFFLR